MNRLKQGNEESLGDQQRRREGKQLDDVEELDFTKAFEDPETGLLCIDKNKTIESVNQEGKLECVHSMVNICHYSYVTEFRANRREE